jgi:hypothetical protein
LAKRKESTWSEANINIEHAYSGLDAKTWKQSLVGKARAIVPDRSRDLSHEVIVAHARNARLIGESRRQDGVARVTGGESTWRETMRSFIR